MSNEENLFNRLHNSTNRNQGEQKRVLCVCSAGLLRSPTAAKILANPPFNFNTRAAGANEEYALILADEVLLYWADEIVCMQESHKRQLEQRFDLSAKKVIVLGIPDQFKREDPVLIRAIKEKYISATNFVEAVDSAPLQTSEHTFPE